jgi:Ca-activated chloride channel family protein
MANIRLQLRARTWLPLIGSSLVLCLSILAFTTNSKSQSQGPLHPPRQAKSKDGASQDGHINPLRIAVNVVLVPVVVTDAMNHAVTGLGKENFAISDNDENEEIQYFYTEDSPISVGLLLDLSKSMTDKFDSERLAITKFFENANAQDDYFVVTFATHAELLSDATQSIDSIQTKLGAAVPNGSTAMLDAISMAMTRMHAARYKRRALLIISDGGDNNSRHKFREIKSLVRDSDVEVYAIGLFDTTFFKTFEEFMGKKWLGELTDATGGRTITVDNVDKMGDAAATISHELRNQYILGYKPSGPLSNGKRRQIKVKVINSDPGSPQLQAYYKRGYVIPKDE